MTKPTHPKDAPAQPPADVAIPAVGLFGRRCAPPVQLGEPARALFGRRAAEAA